MKPRCAFEFAWASGNIDACEQVIKSWLKKSTRKMMRYAADVTARWASRKASLATSDNQPDKARLAFDDRSIFTFMLDKAFICK